MLLTPSREDSCLHTPAGAQEDRPDIRTQCTKGLGQGQRRVGGDRRSLPLNTTGTIPCSDVAPSCT